MMESKVRELVAKLWQVIAQYDSDMETLEIQAFVDIATELEQALAGEGPSEPVRNLVAEFRKLADAKEYEFKTDPECHDDSFETLRYCASVLEARLNGSNLPLGGDWIEKQAAALAGEERLSEDAIEAISERAEVRIRNSESKWIAPYIKAAIMDAFKAAAIAPQPSAPPASTDQERAYRYWANIVPQLQFVGPDGKLSTVESLAAELTAAHERGRLAGLEEAAKHWPIGELGSMQEFRCSCGAVLICAPTSEERIAAWQQHIRAAATQRKP